MEHIILLVAALAVARSAEAATAVVVGAGVSGLKVRAASGY
jgi:hypothetical protein